MVSSNVSDSVRSLSAFFGTFRRALFFLDSTNLSYSKSSFVGFTGLVTIAVETDTVRSVDVYQFLSFGGSRPCRSVVVDEATLPPRRVVMAVLTFFVLSRVGGDGGGGGGGRES